ncbi:pyrimidine reductase family protein [Streptomyces spirodelae]|uniref:Pyrimidine reductase family protein n=1 Tax=Streptomyces spirodelae TaxID=2812904 RepID=A0ABS3WQQ4_9ACTN|nr:pyrimidine reductase family protein [Streptomyces spirodelae]MBO8185448.1 pyrimidine reductase family protein [Streptomyces spirodelae]
MRRLFPSSTAPVPAADAADAPVSPASPAPQAAGPEWSIAQIAEEYAYPPVGEGADEADRWLRANMVASLDGAIHHGGRSQPLSSKADMWIFGVLRALADVVVVGARTVRQEGYRPAKRRSGFADRRAAAGQSPVPAIAVVSASLELDFSAPLFTEPVVPTLLLTGSGAPADRVGQAREAGAEVIFAGEGGAADPARVPGLLAERGLRRQLTEGGPTLLGELADAGVLDELCLSISPRIVAGSAPRIMNGPVLPDPDEFTLEGVLEEDGFLFTRYRRLRNVTE